MYHNIDGIIDPRLFYKKKTNIVIRTPIPERDDELVESDTDVKGYTLQSENIDSEISQDSDSDSDWESTSARVYSNTSQSTNSQSDEDEAGSAAPVDLNDIRWRTTHTIVPVTQWTDSIHDAVSCGAHIEYLTNEVLLNIVEQSNRSVYYRARCHNLP